MPAQRNLLTGHRDLDWLVPGAVLTVGLSVFALGFMPDYSGLVPALLLLPYWMLAGGLMAGIAGFVAIIRMMLANVESPAKRIKIYLASNWRWMAFVAACLLLSGMNMVAFMWTKPLLNYLVPFWADPMLARADRIIFGTDPWRLLDWMNSLSTALFYHRAWFALMIAILLLVLSARPSPEKSALMLTYFLLWSLFGPIVHVLMPAAGPIFFDRLGYGPEFTAIDLPSEATKVADHLWGFYADGGFGPGAGISAMPSLHIATTAWLVIAVHRFARSLLVPVAACAILIFLLSISLGWHYAVDGLAGGLGAVLIWRLSIEIYKRRFPDFGTDRAVKVS